MAKAIIKSKFNKENISNILLILVGTAISALGLNLFYVHAQLFSGGVSGLALIGQYIYSFPAGFSVILLNIPLFILSFRKINFKFTFFSLIGTFFFSFFLLLTAPLKKVLDLNDPLLYCLYGGILNGLGNGLVFSNHGSMGGIDIIAVWFKKRFENINIGAISFALNFIIVLAAAHFFGLNKALYTLVAMYITSTVTNRVINGLNQRKLIVVISKASDQISQTIMTELDRGITFLDGSGAYTNKRKKIIYCVLSLSQLPRAKQIVREYDPQAFMTIIDATEIEGKGFKQHFG